MDVVVIGAGPYGLSVAAHLRGLQIPFRVFGKPMSLWQDHMPKGMLLKSDAFSSNLSAPDNSFPLERFYRETGRTNYSHLGLRVPAETLIEYGHEFQRRYVGEVGREHVVGVARTGGRLEVTLDTGEQVSARKVIVAAGPLSLRHVPDSFSMLPPAMLSHSSAHHDLAKFRGRRVIVVGGGQTACETSALLNEQGAAVTILTRRPMFWFKPENEDNPRAHRSAWRRLRRPNFSLGPGWRTWFWSEAPYQFSYLPSGMRHANAYTTFGPAGSGWLKHRVDGVVPIYTGGLRNVQARGDEVRLSVETSDGPIELAADHVIAATGYKADFRRLSFLDPVQSEIRSVGGVPVLNRAFESTARGIHFVGYLSAPTFGPSMRFIHGTGFTANRISWKLAHLGAGRQRADGFAVRQPTTVHASS